MLKKDDYVIYQKEVCQIKGKKLNEFTNRESFILEPVNDSSLKLTIPVDNPNLRELLTKKELEELLSKIPSIPVIEVEDRELEQEYRNLMRNENEEDLVRVIKTTYLRNKKRVDNNKKISDKDHHYFEMAEDLLYTEIAIILNISKEEAKEYLISKCNK